MLRRVPEAWSSLDFPDTVTLPGRIGCLNWQRLRGGIRETAACWAMEGFPLSRKKHQPEQPTQPPTANKAPHAKSSA